MAHIFSFTAQFNNFASPMDDAIYVRCGRSFGIQKSLHAHEAHCQASKALTADVHCQQRDHTKSKKRKCTISHSPEPCCLGYARFSTPVTDFQPEVMCLLLLDYQKLLLSDDIGTASFPSSPEPG